jgi:hypothetical protein
MLKYADARFFAATVHRLDCEQRVAPLGDGGRIELRIVMIKEYDLKVKIARQESGRK